MYKLITLVMIIYNIIMGEYMRYYMYLDRDFLRNLFSVIDDNNFNIEVVEYSLRKSVTSNNALSVEPCVESGCEHEDSGKNDFEKNNSKFCKDDRFNKERLEISYDKSKVCNIETQVKYINIDDVSDIKNTNFYHKLCENIKVKSTDNNSRIIEEKGYIKIFNGKNRLKIDNINNFFMINNSFVWIDNTKLQGDLELLSQMECEVKVIGYMMNCKKSVDNKILKAIAIYIE